MATKTMLDHEVTLEVFRSAGLARSCEELDGLIEGLQQLLNNPKVPLSDAQRASISRIIAVDKQIAELQHCPGY